MKLSVWIALILLVGVPQGLFAAEDHLDEQQKLGRRLFEQSCGVCHTRPTLISGMYGPELSRLNLGGQEELLRMFISNGTARMPGFKYTYNPEQIAAIAAYIKTLPPGTQDIPTARATYESPHSGLSNGIATDLIKDWEKRYAKYKSVRGYYRNRSRHYFWHNRHSFPARLMPTHC